MERIDAIRDNDLYRPAQVDGDSGAVTRKEMKGAQPEQQHVVAAIRKRLKGGV